jgi:hypothetical protein
MDRSVAKFSPIASSLARESLSAPREGKSVRRNVKPISARE